MRGASLLPLQFVSAWAATTAAPKLKVLCMHGYSQNGAVLRDRSGGFRKPFKKSRFELSYPDGLFGCTKDGEDQDEADADLERRAWWRGHAGQATYVGWDESHASMCELWEREQFDGIIGFSQGAAAAAMLCAELKPRFGIFVAGFVPNDQEAAAVLLAGVDLCGKQGGSTFGQRQTMPSATRSFSSDQARPIGRLGRAGRPYPTGLISNPYPNPNPHPHPHPHPHPNHRRRRERADPARHRQRRLARGARTLDGPRRPLRRAHRRDPPWGAHDPVGRGRPCSGRVLCGGCLGRVPGARGRVHSPAIKAAHVHE